MILNPFEMLGETIQSISRGSHEIEKMPEFVAARFFDVEHLENVTDRAVDTVFGLRNTGDASAAVIDLVNHQPETTPAPQVEPQIPQPQTSEILAPQAEVMNLDQWRQAVNDAYDKAA